VQLEEHICTSENNQSNPSTDEQVYVSSLAIYSATAFIDEAFLQFDFGKEPDRWHATRVRAKYRGNTAGS